MNNGVPSVKKNYTFSKTEYENILELFSVLQKDISAAQNLPEKTRSKLFEKLEEMIMETEISVVTLDIFWSFIARLEIAFKVYEKGWIPVSLREFAGIIWKVQCRTEGRPLNAVPPILF